MTSSVRERFEDYFATLNPTAKRMMADITFAKKQIGENWDVLSISEQEETLWRSLVKSEVEKKYQNTSEPLDVECFPVLRVKPGGKIVVDEEASAGKPFGTSWRDEHSAPFRWETQSQLNLTICDTSLEKDKEPVLKPIVQHTSETVKDEKKEEDTKRPPTIKRPEVPPPPVPPHATPPVPPHNESNPPVPPHTTTTKSDTPIYAKVVKRKSFNAKTLVISEMKAHKKAMEEMKPAVPPRMSLELQIDINPTKDNGSVDAEAIPKTGFDFLDNW